MKLARVIGKVTLSKSHPSLASGSFRCIEMVESFETGQGKRSKSKSDSQKQEKPKITDATFGKDTVVAWDLISSREGDVVAVAEGPEAAAPMKPTVRPVDASLVAYVEALE